MINVTQNKELILSPFCYSTKVFADDLISKLEQHGYRFTRDETSQGITIKWTEYSSIGYDEELLKERRKVLEKYLNEDEPQTYITEDRDTQILDAWQVHHRNTMSGKDEPQTERSE